MTIQPDEKAARAAFGAYVKARRVAKGMQQNELARLLETDPPALCVFENSGTGLFSNAEEHYERSVERAALLSRALDVPLDEVLSRARLIERNIAAALYGPKAPLHFALIRAVEWGDFSEIIALGHRVGHLWPENIRPGLAPWFRIGELMAAEAKNDPPPVREALPSDPRPWPLLDAGMPR